MSWADPRAAGRATASAVRSTAHFDDAKVRTDESTLLRPRRLSTSAAVVGSIVVLLAMTAGVSAVALLGGEPDSAPPVVAAPTEGQSPPTDGADGASASQSGTDAEEPTPWGPFTARGQLTGVALLPDGSTGERVGPIPTTLKVRCSTTGCRVYDVAGAGPLQQFTTDAFGQLLTGPPQGPWTTRPSGPPTTCENSYPPGWKKVTLDVDGERVTGDADSHTFEQRRADGICQTNGVRLAFTGRLLS